jgi:hypothetical protein
MRVSLLRVQADANRACEVRGVEGLWDEIDALAQGHT